MSRIRCCCCTGRERNWVTCPGSNLSKTSRIATWQTHSVNWTKQNGAPPRCGSDNVTRKVYRAFVSLTSRRSAHLKRPVRDTELARSLLQIFILIFQCHADG